MSENKFHEHLDECRQCSEQIFNLCPTGITLLHEAAMASTDRMYRGLEMWNSAVARQSGRP